MKETELYGRNAGQKPYRARPRVPLTIVECETGPERPADQIITITVFMRRNKNLPIKEIGHFTEIITVH